MPKFLFEKSEKSHINKKDKHRVGNDYNIEYSIDLHGFYIEEAYSKLLETINYCYNFGIRNIKIITGKGLHSPNSSNNLKNLVPEWLGESQLHSKIIDYCEAKPWDGGSGALYVLIRRKK